MNSQTSTTGGQLLVDCLVANDVRHAFCVPGESYLAVLDALYEAPIALTVCRQEGGAAMMAEAVGKLTGRPGICFVTRGPGATNASAGVHVAMQDSTPMILFIGQVERGFLEREAFQEVDYTRFFAPICKWAAEIRDAARIPEYINRAFAVATSGRPGPVVLSLPEDMLTDHVTAVAPLPFTPVEPQIGLSDLAALRRHLVAAKRPIVIVGGSGWSPDAVARMQRFAEKWRMPVAVSFRRQMLFDHEHPCFAGIVGIGVDPKLKARIEGADLVVLVGGRLSEMPSQAYTLIDVPNPKQTFVHVHAGAEEIGRVYRPALGIVSGPNAFAAGVDGLEPPIGTPSWDGTAEAAHADYLAYSSIPAETPGRVQMREVMRTITARVPEDAILTNGAGNFATWVHRFHRFRRFGTQLAPTSGSMGYGYPAAVGAKIAFPERTVVCVAGDGDFQMTMQELGTAVQSAAAVITVLVDNGIYGTIRMHQEREYPGRVSGSTLQNPDFAALARSYGAEGYTVRETAEFAPAFEAALASGKPAIIHVLTDPEAITPATTLTQIREAAQKR
jgi:acetolactate synthase-1/2/3 large subunit